LLARPAGEFLDCELLLAQNEHLASALWPKLWPGHDFGLLGQVLILRRKMSTWPQEMSRCLACRLDRAKSECAGRETAAASERLAKQEKSP
jgi:hypothetical protein